MSAVPFIRSIFKATSHILTNTIKTISGGILSVDTNRIANVVDAVNPQDAVTKHQLDDAVNYGYWNINGYSFPILYSYLYNWFAVNNTSPICASNAHVALGSEWSALRTFVGGAMSAYKLKEIGNTYFNNPVGNETNEYGFNARGSGDRIPTVGSFEYLMVVGQWWGAEEWGLGDYRAVTYNVSTNSDSFYSGGYDKHYGNSVRLVVDTPIEISGTNAIYVGNDGKRYNCVLINGVWWMAENLAETQYRDGSLIPIVTDNAAWSVLVTGAMCAYDNDQTNVFETTSVELSIHSHDRLTLRDTPTIKFAITEISDTEVRVEAEAINMIGEGMQAEIDAKVDKNALITPGTKTKITYDAKGLVTSGDNATTNDIASSTDKRYVTDANIVVINNTSGVNTGDHAVNNNYKDLVTFPGFGITNATAAYGDHGHGYGDVFGPGVSVDNCICVYNGITGKLIKLTNVTIDDRGQVVISPIADEGGYCVGLAVLTDAEEGYALWGAAKFMPIEGVTLDVTPTGKKTVLGMRGDSEHMTGAGIAIVGYGLNLNAYIPVQGWVLPGDSERLGGSLSFVIADNTQNAESVDIEFWTLLDGVMTKQGTLDHHGVFTSVNTKQTVFTIVMPISGNVAGRCTGATLGTGAEAWTIAAGDNPIDLLITHNLTRSIASVIVFSLETNGRRQLYNAAAYSGILQPDANTLLIESLATISKAIMIQLIFSNDITDLPS